MYNHAWFIKNNCKSSSLRAPLAIRNNKKREIDMLTNKNLEELTEQDKATNFNNTLPIFQLPTEVAMSIFNFFPQATYAKVAQSCRNFKAASDLYFSEQRRCFGIKPQAIDPTKILTSKISQPHSGQVREILLLDNGDFITVASDCQLCGFNESFQSKYTCQLSGGLGNTICQLEQLSNGDLISVLWDHVIRKWYRNSDGSFNTMSKANIGTHAFLKAFIVTDDNNIISHDGSNICIYDSMGSILAIINPEDRIQGNVRVGDEIQLLKLSDNRFAYYSYDKAMVIMQEKKEIDSMAFPSNSKTTKILAAKWNKNHIVRSAYSLEDNQFIPKFEIWDLNTKKCLRTIKLGKLSIWHINTTQDGYIVASVAPNLCMIWECHSGRLINRFKPFGDINTRISRININENGQLIIGSDDGHVCVKQFAKVPELVVEPKPETPHF